MNKLNPDIHKLHFFASVGGNGIYDHFVDLDDAQRDITLPFDAVGDEDSLDTAEKLLNHLRDVALENVRTQGHLLAIDLKHDFYTQIATATFKPENKGRPVVTAEVGLEVVDL